MKIRALVLAAGLGRRLRPLTEDLPKPLLPVTGKPILSWTLERLRAAGCEAVAVNLFHAGERIRERYGDEHEGLPLVYSEEHELLGTLGALAPLRGFFAGCDLVLVVNGDSFCRWPFRELLAQTAPPRSEGPEIEADEETLVDAPMPDRPQAAPRERFRTELFLAGIVLAVLLAAPFINGCAPLVVGGAAATGVVVAEDRRTVGTITEDQAIELKASSRIGDRVKNGHVNVTSYNRMVLLTGEAPDAAAKASAEKNPK